MSFRHILTIIIGAVHQTLTVHLYQTTIRLVRKNFTLLDRNSSPRRSVRVPDRPKGYCQLSVYCVCIMVFFRFWITDRVELCSLFAVCENTNWTYRILIRHLSLCFSYVFSMFFLCFMSFVYGYHNTRRGCESAHRPLHALRAFRTLHALHALPMAG